MTVEKRDRDEVFIEYTKSICPVCKVAVDAQGNGREDRGYPRERCREHGESRRSFASPTIQMGCR
ncbi:putative radical SAM superfamily Fe-S cluster-containing enzyme [Saccharomonospora amisosensis]|uniref:Putative radical SAM superfamily Fe-S cluster-containing enzyme n=1 Tax=Saccharomonospora amisosensis TaxID=1128677 RepID=A0A7X5UQJ1_9PSEU|nr:hypothetical protein [Saccharomonospora amisosensis]NIJ11908.1 putative radical SAM superfamily Fe-S cluster-containing enzyme [Saccharomonospora amisosensis]